VNRYRIALVGMGTVGRLHLAAARHVAQADVVALVDPVAPDLQALAAPLGARSYTDAATMLDAEAPDLVCILAPVARHAELVALCAARGVHVLCEKPLALHSAEAATMIHQCRAAGVRLFYGASYRFLPALQAACAIMRDGGIGQPLLMTESILCGSGPADRHKMAPGHYPAGTPGGYGWGLVDHGVHLIDAFAWLSGSAIVSAHGRGSLSGEQGGLEYAIAHHANGAVTQLTYDDGTYPACLPNEGIFSEGAGWDQAGNVDAGQWSAHPQDIRIHGTEGSLRIFHYANILFLRDRAGLRKLPVAGRAPNLHFASQLEAALHDLDDGGQRVPSGEDGRRALQVIDSIYRSMSTGRLEAVGSG
jgi:predicted dehydrogenase